MCAVCLQLTFNDEFQARFNLFNLLNIVRIVCAGLGWLVVRSWLFCTHAACSLGWCLCKHRYLLLGLCALRNLGLD